MTNFLNFSSANMPSFRCFLSFFSYLTITFWFILCAECFFLFLKFLTVLFATLLSDSSTSFLVFKRSFLNILKSFLVGFETFVTTSLNSWASHRKLTRQSFYQSKLRKQSANLVLCVFRYLRISCNLEDWVTMSNDFFFFFKIRWDCFTFPFALGLYGWYWTIVSFPFGRIALLTLWILLQYPIIAFLAYLAKYRKMFFVFSFTQRECIVCKGDNPWNQEKYLIMKER